MKVIEAKNITKIYTETSVPVHAINGIDMEIEKGEFTAIVGPSGCGKTTLLNIIGGLDNPTTGEVMINGKDITSLSDSRKIEFRLNNIGFVFQSYNLIPVLTARENVEFIMLLQKIPAQKRRERAMELLTEVGLSEIQSRCCSI
jgi:putative ABC transport system ATP-binding protein